MSKGIKKLFLNLNPDKAGPNEIQPKIHTAVCSKNRHLSPRRSFMSYSQDDSPHILSPMTRKWKWSLLSSKRASRTVLSTIVQSHSPVSVQEQIITSAWCPTSMRITFYTTYSMVFVRIVLVKHSYRNFLSTLASGNQTDLIILDFSRAIAEVC